MGTQLFILDGGPKVAFYDGLVPASNAINLKNDEVKGGWRQVEANGKDFIEPDSFFVQCKYTVEPSQEVAFETKFNEEKADLTPLMAQLDFICFEEMRIKRMMVI